MVGFDVNASILKPGAVHRARWMAKAIYSLKIELLLSGNEDEFHLTSTELKGIQRFNRFVVWIYIQSWFTCRSAVDAPVHDMSLMSRLNDYNYEQLRDVGLKMLKRHSWYLSPELTTLALFSDLLSTEEKKHIVQNITSQRGPHIISALPQNVIWACWELAQISTVSESGRLYYTVSMCEWLCWAWSGANTKLQCID